MEVISYNIYDELITLRNKTIKIYLENYIYIFNTSDMNEEINRVIRVNNDIHINRSYLRSLLSDILTRDIPDITEQKIKLIRMFYDILDDDIKYQIYLISLLIEEYTICDIFDSYLYPVNKKNNIYIIVLFKMLNDINSYGEEYCNKLIRIYSYLSKNYREIINIHDDDHFNVIHHIVTKVRDINCVVCLLNYLEDNGGDMSIKPRWQYLKLNLIELARSNYRRYNNGFELSTHIRV